VAPEDSVSRALPSVEGSVLSEDDTTPVVLVGGVMPEDPVSNDVDVVPEDAHCLPVRPLAVKILWVVMTTLDNNVYLA
jgi:hypothetical protein